ERHDLALLILRKPIKLERYGKIQARPCPGCSVVQIGRDHAADGVHTDLAAGEPTQIANSIPNGRRTNLYVHNGISDSGGAVVRSEGALAGRIVGVTIGRGKATGGGYIARLDHPFVQLWIRAVVFSVSRHTDGTPASHALDDSGDEPTTDSDSTG